jgi:hypothetical protein
MNFISVPPARELTRTVACAKCGHGNDGDRVTMDENATGVPRVDPAPRRSDANLGTVVRLRPIARRRFGLRSRRAEPDPATHIRNAAVEFRVSRRPPGMRRGLDDVPPGPDPWEIRPKTLLLPRDAGWERRDHVSRRIVAHPSVELAGAGRQVHDLTTVIIGAAREQSIGHAPLLIFALAAAVLTFFMLRT